MRSARTSLIIGVTSLYADYSIMFVESILFSDLLFMFLQRPLMQLSLSEPLGKTISQTLLYRNYSESPKKVKKSNRQFECRMRTVRNHIPPQGWRKKSALTGGCIGAHFGGFINNVSPTGAIGQF